MELLNNLCDKENISICKMDRNNIIKYAGTYNDAFATVKNDKKLIIISDELENEAEISYCIAHELGHHLLGHFTKGKSITDDENKFLEIEAIVFGTTMLALDLFTKGYSQNK